MVSLCSNFSNYSIYEKVREGFLGIDRNMTPQEFNKKIKNIDGYKLTDGVRCGWHALNLAALKGNASLARYIVKNAEERKESVLNLGNDFGMTPLYCAASCQNPEDGLHVAQELINLGADVNIGIIYKPISGEQKPPKCATPLWAAAEKTKNYELVKLLLQNGAVVLENLYSEEGKAMIATVLKEIDQMEKKENKFSNLQLPENPEK